MANCVKIEKRTSLVASDSNLALVVKDLIASERPQEEHCIVIHNDLIDNSSIPLQSQVTSCVPDEIFAISRKNLEIAPQICNKKNMLQKNTIEIEITFWSILLTLKLRIAKQETRFHNRN